MTNLHIVVDLFFFLCFQTKINHYGVFILQVIKEMVDFYGPRYGDKMCKQVYSSIGNRMLAEYGDLARDGGFSKNKWAPLTREVSAKIRSQRYYMPKNFLSPCMHCIFFE
jgi:hypothetical protein